MARLSRMHKVGKQNAFDPNKNYKWEEDDIFEFTGQQVAVIYHALSQEIKERGGAPISLKYSAYEVIMDIFKAGVENGVITEQSSNVTDGTIHTSE